jgi:hypothetical protein
LCSRGFLVCLSRNDKTKHHNLFLSLFPERSFLSQWWSKEWGWEWSLRREWSRWEVGVSSVGNCRMKLQRKAVEIQF